MSNIIFLRKPVEISLGADSVDNKAPFPYLILVDFNWDGFFDWQRQRFSGGMGNLLSLESVRFRNSFIHIFRRGTLEYSGSKSVIISLSLVARPPRLRRNPLTIGVLLVNKIVDRKSIVNYANEGILLKMGHLLSSMPLNLDRSPINFSHGLYNCLL